MASPSLAAAPRPPGAAAPATAAAPFILGAPADLGLMVAAPVWILPLLFLIGATVGDRNVNLAVGALGATGHHLPGMLRAYGDRALFRRFRARFVAAPVVLAVLCLAVSTRGLHPIVLIAFVWGVWHALAQTYGFARIYAAKEGAGDRDSARADRALLVTWFLAIVVLSPLRLYALLDLGAACGLPLPSAGALAGLRQALVGATVVATAWWLVVVVRGARAGRGPGLIRLLLLGTSIGFWGFANVRVQHLLLATPLFEVFHDAQYLAIVWAFNRRRVDTAGVHLAAPMRALFQSTALAVVVYVLAVLAYGAIALYPASWPMAPWVMGLVAASQLLHFYFDGFIWKVRDRDTSEVLGVGGPGKAAARPAASSSWPALRHALLWLLVIVPYVGLWYGESEAGMPPAERRVEVAALVPDNALGRFEAAELLWQAGRRDEALAGFRAALALDPRLASARRNLAFSLCELADQARDGDDRAALAGFIAELRDLRPGLDPADASFVDRRLAGYAAPRP